MKNIILILTILLSFNYTAQAQITKSEARTAKAFSQYSEDFTIKVDATGISLQFEHNDVYLDQNLKTKLQDFFNNPPSGGDYNSRKVYKLRLVKKDDAYYVAEGNNSFEERLYKL